MDDDVYTYHIQEEYKLIFDALQSKIIECWTRISTNWSEELFMNQLDKWENIQKSIFSKVSTLVDIPSHLLDKTCKTCRTIWSNKEYLHRQCIKLENIFDLGFIDYISMTDVCPNCDSFMNPFLSNPINEEYVRRYIPKKFHKYILISSHKSYEMGYHKGKLDGIDKAINDSYKINTYFYDNNDVKLDPELEDYPYSDGYEEGFNIYYKKTYKLNDIFMIELKEYIDRKKFNTDDIITDYYMIKKLNDYDSDFSDRDDEWLMVE